MNNHRDGKPLSRDMKQYGRYKSTSSNSPSIQEDNSVNNRPKQRLIMPNANSSRPFNNRHYHGPRNGNPSRPDNQFSELNKQSLHPQQPPYYPPMQPSYPQPPYQYPYPQPTYPYPVPIPQPPPSQDRDTNKPNTSQEGFYKHTSGNDQATDPGYPVEMPYNMPVPQYYSPYYQGVMYSYPQDYAPVVYTSAVPMVCVIVLSYV